MGLHWWPTDAIIELLHPLMFCSLKALYCDGPHTLLVIFLTAMSSAVL